MKTTDSSETGVYHFSETPSYIKIEASQVAGNTATFVIAPEGPVRKVLRGDTLFYKTDFDLENIPRALLAVPILGCLASLSWVTNATVTADEVDVEFLNCLPRLRMTFAKTYPGIPLRGEIHAVPVECPLDRSSDSYCLLFSGGVDSTASYLRNASKKPALVMIRGTPDVGFGEVEYWNRVLGRVRPFVSGLGADLHTVETNFLDVVDFRSLRRTLSPQLDGGWWENLAHGLLLTSMCAPFTHFYGINRVLIASSYSVDYSRSWGSMPEVDELIRWSEVEVKHDSFDLSRFEKVRQFISPLAKELGGLPLRVCTGSPSVRLATGKLNCGRCGKCTRTMLMLLETGVDPAMCDFDVSEFSPKRIKSALENGYLHTEEAPASWKSLFENVPRGPSVLESRYPGTNALFRWMADWDRQPMETKLRSYSKLIAPVGSTRRKLVRRLVRFVT